MLPQEIKPCNSISYRQKKNKIDSEERLASVTDANSRNFSAEKYPCSPRSAILFSLLLLLAMQGPISIFYFIILIASIIVHEVAHGIAAEQEGDPTARLQGRITLNPLKHLDLFGSVLLPLVLILTNAGVVLGWAKPVPYNPENLRNGNKSSLQKLLLPALR